MNIENYVKNILEEVQKEGIEALRRYSKKFDDYEGKFKVSEDELSTGDEIPEKDKETIDRIIKRVEKHHECQKRSDEFYQNKGSLYGLIYRPIERIGIYVPGGKSLVSSLIMSGVPANVAGVDEVVISSPPKDGKLDPYFLYTAKTLGFSDIYKIGGIQAIASMAYGVCSENVDKIIGPGNKYVNEAKRQLFGTVGIDCLAGPSEICIIADETAETDNIISDLEAQLEHGESSKAWLLTTAKDLKESVGDGRDRIEISLKDDLVGCVEKANEIAPEHLQINTELPMRLIDEVKNAGAVYLGNYTPAAAADYFLGVNHVLPTGKAAKFHSVLNVMDFMKPISFAHVDKKEYSDNFKLGVRMAKIEDMEKHKKSMEERI